jgi:hypothetical protein
MRPAIFIVGIIFFFATLVSAQGPAGAGSEGGYLSSGEHAENKWEIAVDYQYNRDNLLGSPFNTHGLNVSAARYFGRWLGAEAEVGSGFLGNTGQTSTPPDLHVKSVFFGAGPKLAWRTRSRYEPWAHVLVGLDHYRFTQTAGVLGNNTALGGTGGAGVDIYLLPHIGVRAEADFIESRFFSTYQRSFQIVGGMVFGF